MPHRPLAHGALINLCGRAATVAAGLLLMALVARLGPSSQGTFALFVACESILLTLFSGFGLLLARAHSRQAGVVPAHARPLDVLHSTLVAAALAVGAAASVALLAVSSISREPPYASLWLLALGAPFLLIVPTVSGAWLGRAQLWPLNGFALASPLVALAGALLLTWLAPPLQVGTVLALWVAGKSLVGMAALAWSVRTEGWARPDGALLRSGLGFIAVIGVTNVVSLLNYRVNLFMVERLDSLSSAGVYSVAVTVAELLWFVSSAVTTAVYGRIGSRDAADAAAGTLQALRWGALGVLLAAPLLLLAAWWALPAVLGEAYRPAWGLLLVLVPGTLAYSSASGISAWFTNQRGQPWLAGGIALTSMLLNVALSSWWIPLWGATGAAAATSASYMLAIALGLGLFLRLAGLPARALWGPAAPAQSAA